MNAFALIFAWLAFGKLQRLPEHPTERSSSLWDTLKSRAVWTLAIFLMLYVGYVPSSHVKLLRNDTTSQSRAEESL